MNETWIPEITNEFIPQEKHTIDSGIQKNHVFGGVIHGVGTLAAPGTPVYSQTNFYRSASAEEPIKIIRQAVSSNLYLNTLEQDDYLISKTIVGTSEATEPELKISPTEMKDFRPDEFDFSGWGTGSDIMYYLTGNFRRSEAKMWLKEHAFDIGVLATLADFSAIQLVPYVGQFGLTRTLTSHFTSNMPVKKSYVKHAVEGTSNGVVFTRLDQYDDEGNPACLSRGVFKIATKDQNEYPEHFGADAKFIK